MGLEGHLAVIYAIDPVVVLRPHGDWKRGAGMVTPAASIRKQEKNVTVTNLVTNLVIIELVDGRAPLHVGLCHCENPLRGENEQSDTSGRSSPPSSCSSDRPDFASSSCRPYTVTKSAQVFSDGMSKSYGIRVRWFVVMAIQCRRLLILLCLRSRYLHGMSMSCPTCGDYKEQILTSKGPYKSGRI